MRVLMVATRNELRLLGLLALLLPLYGVVQLWLQSEPSTRVEVRTITEPVPVRVEVPVEVQVPVERIVFVPVPTLAAGTDGEGDCAGSAEFPPPGLLLPAQGG